LREWSRNPRFISDQQHRALTENNRKYGIIDPLIVDQQYSIVDGHQLKVLKNLGLKTVPVLKLQLSRRDFKIVNLALNKLPNRANPPHPNESSRTHIPRKKRFELDRG
jgi:ParB-like chromosome segregation protein Spo0J